MISLGKRLTISLAVSLAIFSVTLALMVMVEVRQLSDESLSSRLEHDAEQLLTLLTRAPDGALMLDQSQIQNIYKQPFSGHYFQIQSQQQQLSSRSLWDESLPQPSSTTSRVAGPNGQELLVFSHSYVIHGVPVTIATAEDVSPLNATTAAFLKRLLLLSLVCVLLLLAMQLFFIRLGLRPLHQLRTELSQLETGAIESLQQPVPAEIAPLVDEANRLLVVMRQRLERSRHAIGNLAHALKTPLTVITQILSRQPDTEDCRQMREQVELIQQRVMRELSHARMAGQATGGFWRKPEQDIDDLVATLQSIHRKPIRKEMQMGPTAAIRADREDMMELIGNLLDNACKWAKSEVALRISTQPFTIIVEDDGPGVDEATQQRVMQRGVRADESKAGHGLGLAIVSDLVETYGGDIAMQRSAMGGLKVHITIPEA